MKIYRGRPNIFFVIIILIISIVVGIYIIERPYFEQSASSIVQNQINNVPSSNIPERWKTYTLRNILTFRYPPDYIVNQPSSVLTFVVGKRKPDSPIYGYMSIDTGFVGIYSDYNTAISVGDFTNKKYKSDIISNGIKFSRKFNDGNYGVNAYIKYDNKAIVVQYNDDEIGIKTFDKILSTIHILR